MIEPFLMVNIEDIRLKIRKSRFKFQLWHLTESDWQISSPFWGQEGLLRENESAKFLMKFLKMLIKCELKLLHWWLKWNLWDVIKCSETKTLMIQNYLVASGTVRRKLCNTTFSPVMVICIHPISYLKGSACSSTWLVVKYISTLFLFIELYIFRAKINEGRINWNSRGCIHHSRSLVPFASEE